MTTHLSARLAWHDRGWDAHVCLAPHLNASCIALRNIHEERDDERERQFASTPISRLEDWQPPCAHDIGAYAAYGHRIAHRHPFENRSQQSIEEYLPPYTNSVSPFRWMREDNFATICRTEGLNIRPPSQVSAGAWVAEPHRQYLLLNAFWQKLTPEKSLVFYYCKASPLGETDSRMIVGVGRINALGPQQYFTPTEYPVWSRAVTQDYPQQGVRLPYQEYLAAGRAVEPILCPVPECARVPFSFVGEHVSDDIAVAILERIIQSVEHVRVDGVVSGDWDGRLAWLNDALAEVWHGRGAFPGLGSVLHYLGFTLGVIYQREVLAPLAQQGINSWEYVLAVLAGAVQPDPRWVEGGMLTAGERWRQLPARRRELLADLCRYELSDDQIRRIADPDQRSQAGLARNGVSFTDADILANPYVIAESDRGTRASEPVAIETIDHGMVPEGGALLFRQRERLAHDDRRRVRAVGHAVLVEAATRGDTVLTFDQTLSRIRELFPTRRACLPERDVVLSELGFHQTVLHFRLDSEPATVALNSLRIHEDHIARVLAQRAGKTHVLPAEAIPWRQALEQRFGAPTTQRAEAALKEKTLALQTLFEQRLSVLTGGAGTGKTSVLQAFLTQLARIEGTQPTILLAPTGKAKLRLGIQASVNAQTVHQFLLRQGWLDADTLALRESSERSPAKLTTVVIDECSMIPVDILGALFRALDMNTIRRLILVGDPNQLPPIGPGRPFVDVIRWLKEEHPACVAALRVCMRTDTDENDHNAMSVALSLADGYRVEEDAPDNDEIVSLVAHGVSRGDLDVVYWRDHDDLLVKLKERMVAHLGIALGDSESFNRSLGATESEWARCESWQIISPTRTQPFGSDELNRRIQLEYHSALLSAARFAQSTIAYPAGDQRIVWLDKVMQTRNHRRVARRPGRQQERDEEKRGYVANGEIGMVNKTTRGRAGVDASLEVTFATQPDVTYRFRPSEVNDNLELAYAITVHKAQGSDFETVFFVVPQNAATLSRELMYTGLTRFRKRLVLLIERDTTPLVALRSPERSETLRRSTNLFSLALSATEGVRPYPEALIHRTTRGVLVRSKSEVVVADILTALGISYEYEKPVYARNDAQDRRWPDFTVSFIGDTYYWEHLGLLDDQGYRERWESKLRWYQENGYLDRLITSADGPGGSINAEEIERIARKNILGEDV